MDPQISRRVLTGDDGAPIDSDCVLAIATRWEDVALSLTHLKPGVELTPTEGMGVRWENGLPVISTTGEVRAFIERAGAEPSESGRLTALELGDVFLAKNGSITIEARLQRKSELAAAMPKRDTRTFALVMAHSLMFAVAVLAVMVLTPIVPDESAFGHPIRFRIPVTPMTSLPRIQAPSEIQEKIQKVAISTIPVLKTTVKSTAKELLNQFFKGAGADSLFDKGSGEIDKALGALGNGNGTASFENSGIGGSRGEGGGGKGDGLHLGGLGTNGRPGGPGPGFGIGENAKKPENIICANCTPKLSPGYDRDLVLKVVRRHQNEIRFCYESELQKHPELGGKITVAWTIGATGSVESAEVAESGLRNETVESCIVQRIRRWNFPEPQGGQEVGVTFPWVFQVAGAE